MFKLDDFIFSKLIFLGHILKKSAHSLFGAWSFVLVVHVSIRDDHVHTYHVSIRDDLSYTRGFLGGVMNARGSQT